MRPLGLALLGLVACEAPEPREGIAIGNGPGASLLRGVPAENLQVTYTVFHYRVDVLYLEDCEGQESVGPSEGTLDLVGDDPVPIPAGTWCTLGFSPSEPVELRGDVTGGGSFVYTADHSRLMLYGEIDIPSLDPLDPTMPTGNLVLEAGTPEFIPQAILDLSPGEELSLGIDCDQDPTCLAIREAIALESALYIDTDGNGRISDPERDAGERATGAERGD